MKNRISDLLNLEVTGPIGSRMAVVTFHGLCARLLRTYGHAFLENASGPSRLGSDFTIAATSDSMRIVRSIVSEDPSRRGGSAEALWRDIQKEKKRRGLAFNSQYDPISTLDSTQASHRDLQINRILPDMVNRYNQLLHASNTLDFEDLIHFAITLMTQHPNIRNNTQNRFPHILVDEVQDTDMAQFELLRLLWQPTDGGLMEAPCKSSTAQQRSLFLVGDTNQSIYGWRDGSMGRGGVEDMLQWLQQGQHQAGMQGSPPHSQQTGGPSTTFSLLLNYRSSPVIIRVAQTLLGSASGHSVYSVAPDHKQSVEYQPVRIYKAANESEEGTFICRAIADSRKSGASCAVLYRTNAQAAALEVRRCC